MSFRVSHRGDLEVVIPRGFDPRTIPQLVERHRTWIDRRLAQTAHDRALMEPEPPDGKPRDVRLRALDESWSVAYAPTAGLHVRIARHPCASGDDLRLRVSGPVGNAEACRGALRRWLRRRGRDCLVPRVQELANQHGFDFERVTVRMQKTRWGSCSTSGTISLNAKSLFLPPELAEHLLLHELCHTVHGNHSGGFHALLNEHSADAARLEGELKRAWLHVPDWAEE